MQTLLHDLASHFNPRLHPLLAVGIGFALAVLLLPAPRREAEHHSAAEILSRLVAPEVDFEHGPLFWLGELRTGSELAVQAQDLCAQGLYSLRPGCRMLASLQRLTAPVPDAVAIPPTAPAPPDVLQGEP